MPGDPYYRTTAWRKLRDKALQRDGYRCAVAGCKEPATCVDHIFRRRDGGPDTVSNLRCLCKHHDNSIKERPNGLRSHNGRLFLDGVDEYGSPLDADHPWNR